MRQIIISETKTAPAVYLLDRSADLGSKPWHDYVLVELRGEQHRIPWALVQAAAEQSAPDAETEAIRMRYRAIRDAALRSLSGAARRRGAITQLVDEGRRHLDRGDYAQLDEVERTLDSLIGRWLDGVWVGGHAAVRGMWAADKSGRAIAGAS